ncbi:MAG: MarR family winged helix-turn-helix transcriptional regulator [Gemmatimonadaceae bacterium]
MGTERSLSRELVDLSFALMDIIKQEFKLAPGDAAPTFTQCKMLAVIKGGVCHVGKLSEVFGISQPAASLMVDAMVKDGLISKVPLPEDRRQIRLRLTRRATASINAVHKRAFKQIDARLAGLSAARKKALARQVREIARLVAEQAPPK